MEEPAREALNRLAVLSDQALDQVRSLSHRLHPAAWLGQGLSKALGELVDSSGIRKRFRTTLVAIEEIHPEPGRTAKAAIYRCAQECIANAIRHSEASSLAIPLQAMGEWLEFKVTDNGRSISEEAIRKGGLGLRAMREHAALAGGECRILTGDQGTTIVLKVPAGR